MPDVLPSHDKEAFNCPHCGAYSHQRWLWIYGKEGQGPYGGSFEPLEGYRASRCHHCHQPTLWHIDRVIYPATSTAPASHPDTPPDVAGDYNEARVLADISPRSAAALLRLALQKLCVHLGQPGRNLNDDIASLVKNGLDVSVQKAADILRITGNNAVHPGELDLRDDRATAEKLFRLLNVIVQQRITQPREIEELWGKMPDKAREAVERRDRRE